MKQKGRSNESTDNLVHNLRDLYDRFAFADDSYYHSQDTGEQVGSEVQSQDENIVYRKRRTKLKDIEALNRFAEHTILSNIGSPVRTHFVLRWNVTIIGKAKLRQ